MDSPREEVHPQGGVWSAVSEATEKWNGVQISEVVAVGHVEEPSDADLRGVTGVGKMQDKAGG